MDREASRACAVNTLTPHAVAEARTGSQIVTAFPLRHGDADLCRRLLAAQYWTPRDVALIRSILLDIACSGGTATTRVLH